jgi:hypothetical protein
MLLFPFPPSFVFSPFGIWNESNAKGSVESTLGIPDDERGLVILLAARRARLNWL